MGQRQDPLSTPSAKTRPVCDVAGQLGLLTRKEGQPSVADRWFSEVGEYFVQAGALKASPDPKRYIDEYMKLAAAELTR